LTPEATIFIAPLDDRLGEHGGGRRAIAGDVVRLRRHLLGELGAHVLEGVFELDLPGDGDAVLGDAGRAVLLLDDDDAAPRPKRDLHGIGESVDAVLERFAGCLVEQQLLGSHGLLLPGEGWRAPRARRGAQCGSVRR
jgi:hypothetical protein